MRRLRDVIFALAVVLAPLVLPEDRFFDSAGVRIRYVERGGGEPVVLLHGFSQDVETNWVEPGILDTLARHYRVVAMDARGHGKSGKPQGDSAYGRKMVEDVARLLDHLRVDSVHFIGCSMGGRIALRFAATYPGRVRSVVLIGAGGAGECEDPAFWDSVAESLERGEGIRPLILRIRPAGQPEPNEEQIAAINEKTLSSNDPNALASVARGYRDFATSQEQIEAIRAPVLAVLGSDDGFRADVERLKERMPRLRTHIVQGVDHVSILERPELLAAIEAFLKES